MKAIPTELTRGPFTRAQAEALGVTSRMLEGARFVRIHPRVWRHRDHVLTEVGLIKAATLALPPSAKLTGITRIQQLGLDYGPRSPLHFVVEGDLHLALDGIFLHRTVALPPLQDDQISQELLSTPRLAVGAVHRALVSRGYDGPPPNFGQRWRSLFIELTKHVPRNRRRAVS